MFRKLVSNLAFSPALVGQLSFYARRLKKEEATRKLGLVFTALALVVQSFAVFSPPEAANAASARDLIYGGVSSKNEFLAYYDQNHRGLKDIANYIGITRAEIAATSGKTLFNVGSKISWGRQAITSTANGEVRHNANGTTVYSHPMYLLYKRGAASNDYGYIGHSAKIGWFAITPGCGNFVTTRIPTPPPAPTPPPPPAPTPMCTVPGKTHLQANDPNCFVPCAVPGKTHLPANDPNCKVDPVASCTALRVTPLGKTYQFDAAGSAANGATIVSYTYTVKRDGQLVHTKTIQSSESTNSYAYVEDKEGNYTVTVTVKTSIGDKTSADCEKTFVIPPPERCPLNPDLLKEDPECQPCPGDPTIWIKDDKCVAAVVSTKTAANTSQGSVDATTKIAKASDKIVYTLNVENTGLAPTDVTIVEDLSDVLEYATIIDTGGGTESVDPEHGGKTLTWPTITLEPGEKQSRLFTVQMLSTIPAMGTGTSDGTSYDCKITNTFGNAVDVNVDCPIQKIIVEQAVTELPHTGPTENMIFAGAVLSVVAYFYARSRQMKKEVRLIRRELNAGTI